MSGSRHESKTVRPSPLSGWDGALRVCGIKRGTSHPSRLIPPSSIGASKHGSHASQTAPTGARMLLNRLRFWCRHTVG